MDLWVAITCLAKREAIKKPLQRDRDRNSGRHAAVLLEAWVPDAGLGPGADPRSEAFAHVAKLGQDLADHPVSTSPATGGSRVVTSGLKDAVRRRSRRSPLAILDPSRATSFACSVATRVGFVAGTKEPPLQPNQGTWFGSDDACGPGVASWVVGFAVLPGSPEDAYPGAGQDTHRVSEGARDRGVLAPTLTGFLVDRCPLPRVLARPCAGMARVVRETCESHP
jgi:hypothetical protein